VYKPALKTDLNLPIWLSEKR